MKLYVTGGTGLVGSNVIRLARQQGHEIIASQYGPEPEWDVDYELDPLDMGDVEGARSTLEEVMAEGNDDQKKEAKELLHQTG